MRELLQFISTHQTICLLVTTAIVSTMPAPGTKLSWRALYEWIFGALHQVFNVKRPAAPDATANPQPPV